MKTKTLVPIMIFLLVAAMAMPASASPDSGLYQNDPLANSLGHFIPGYGIIAYTISLDAHPEKIPADGVSTSTITSQLKDKRGKDVKVKDVIVNFRTTEGTLSANSAVTDDNGKATVTLTSSTKQNYALIKATSDSVLIPGITGVRFMKVSDEAFRISLIPNPDKIPADGESTSTITAQLMDRNGKDVKAKDLIINFRTTEGTLSANSAVTDDNGKATVILTSSIKQRTAIIITTSNSVLIPGITVVRFVKK